MEFTREEKILEQVVAEAWDNPTFKQELIANPQKAVKELTGENFNLPEGKTLEVCDQSKPGVLYLNIPEKPSMDDVELTEDQLETVAGGGVPIGLIIGCIWPPINIWPPRPGGPFPYEPPVSRT